MKPLSQAGEKLAAWLDRKGMKRAEFAKAIGVKPPTVTGYCDGSFLPSMRRSARIFEVTQGEVTPNDWGAV